MATWKGVVGKSFTPDGFAAYIAGLKFNAWRPRFVVVHNTSAPDTKTWQGWQARKITDDAVETIAKFATSVNEQTENIGARRLHTILEKVLDELSFEASDLKKKNVKVDAAYVNKQLADIVKNQDLSRYIL